MTSSNLFKKIEMAIRFGNTVLLENIQETIDSSLDQVLMKQLVQKGSSFFIKIYDVEIPYNNDFKFFITTKLKNPHYLPDISIKVNLINFTVTKKGLEE